MPLSAFQAKISRLLAVNRTPDSHLAGGAALHFKPNSKRYSNDLDYFHDSEQRVAEAFAADRALLEKKGIRVATQITQPGYIRALAEENGEATKIEWAHDSAWRFMPCVKLSGAGYALHPVDLAINKILALAGRDEPRDFLDALYAHETILPFPALVWAAVGKDPGFTPFSLLELLRRRGKYQPVDFERLSLTEPVKPTALKEKWLEALADAEKFIQNRPPEELGCLYYSPSKPGFILPGSRTPKDAVIHFGKPGGVLPELYSG